MKSLRVPSATRTFFVPVVLTVSLMLICSGMRVPSLASPSKLKPRPRAVLESRVKEPSEGVSKSSQVLEHHSHEFVELPRPLFVARSRHVSLSNPADLIAAIPARASPPAIS